MTQKLTFRDARKAALLLIFTGMLLFSALSVVPATTSADELVDLVVWGIVYDIDNNVVQGATVTVTIQRNAEYQIDDTDINGVYTVRFDKSLWQQGDRLDVAATKDSNTAPSNYSFAPALATLQIDAQFSTAIPEFGASALGFVAVLVAMGTLCVFLLGRKSRL